MSLHAIRSKRIISPEGTRDGFLLIKDGKIAGIESKLDAVDIPVTDAEESVIMAGIVDPHVHINEPGRAEWEGFDTATKAALAGGITSMVEMPLNASPVTTTVAALEQKIKSTHGKLHCNCGFWGGVVPGNDNDIVPLIKAGVPGFKAFLTDSGIDEFPKVREQDLRRAMPVLAKYNLPLLVHCELGEPEQKAAESNRSYANYLSSRPPDWEDSAIALMIRLCREFNCRTHIVHLSAASSIEQIRKARKEGLPLTVETSPHYLFFNSEEIPDGATAFKCAPPIRSRANNELLWQALQDGIIDFVATDHSPAPPQMRQTETGDFMNAWGGIASIQFSLSILWTAGQSHGITIDRLAKWLCEAPALLPGFTHKGILRPGCDADIVAWDSDASFTVSPDIIHHRHSLTPYLGRQLNGKVQRTWLAGQLAYENGNFLDLNKGHILKHDPN
jgi:allantoinase